MTRAPAVAVMFLGLLVQVLGCGGGSAPCVPVDDGNPCTDDLCEDGVAVHHPTAAGTSCSTGGAQCDGMGSCAGCVTAADCPGSDDECQTRTCQAGTCGVAFTASGTPVAAQTPHDCQSAVCDGQGKVTSVADDGDLPLDDGNACTDEVCSAGAPGHPASADGTACTDGDACTVGDTCQGGACAGAPVVCSALDQCHVAGVCDPTSGVCSDPSQADSSACDDGDACTVGDTCQSGACVGGVPVVCSASDPCHVAGVCDPASGTCSNPAASDGTACNDGNACTKTDTCQAGACTGGAPVVCGASDQCHVAGSCDAATGLCSSPAAANGTACNDGNACTQSDTCQAGTCAGGNPVVCPAGDQCHTAGVCNPASGTCSNTARPDGFACTDGNACTQSDTCQSGTCTGSNPVVCGALDQCHVAGNCDAATGLCSNPAAANGTACTDGDACTQSDTCQAGTCTAGNPVVCAATDQCHPGVCNPASGTCSNPAAANGTACNDGNACTKTDTCQAGTCTGVNPVVCAPPQPCHLAGVCNPADGTCSSPPAADGKACTDGNACTKTDTCQGGACVGGNPVVCAASDQCHVAGVCNPASGTCSSPAAANGTACSDGDVCTKTDTCQAGNCVGGNPVVCGPGLSCLAGACVPGGTWADCSVGADPTKNGGDLLWVKQTQFAWGNDDYNPADFDVLALGPTGDIALGVAAGDPYQSAFLYAAYQRLNGSGVLLLSGDYRPTGHGVQTNIGWSSLAIASNDDLLISVGGYLPCGSQWCGSGPVMSFQSSAGVQGSKTCDGAPNGTGYCGATVNQTLTPTGQLTAALLGVPDGMGGTYVSGPLYATQDLGCGPMVPTSPKSGYVAHLGPTSSCIYSRVLPVVAAVVADANGAVLSVSSTVGLDLGCGALAAAAGGSTFVTRLGPAGSCVFGRSLSAPWLAVVLDPSGSAVVSGLVGATPVDLGGGPLAPLGSEDVVLGELDVSGNYLWGKRFGGPGGAVAASDVSVSAAGDVYLRTGWSGSVDLGGGAITAASHDTVVGSYSPSGAHRWSRGFPIAGSYRAGIDGCGSLVLASVDPQFNPGGGNVLQCCSTYVDVALVRFAP